MYKTIPIGGWDFGVEPMEMVKVSSRGFLRSDRDEFLHKRAGDHMFADLIGVIKLGSGDVPIHTIAVGATEAWGFNRNADGFNEDTCRKRAHTFESKPLREYGHTPTKSEGARYYRNHDNDNPQASYGYVKKAIYNERMRRIELLMIGNGTKEAAERNGGLIMPEDIKEALFGGKYRAGSMSCILPFDKCAICGNEAPSRKEYCTKEACVSDDGMQGFGCKEGLGKFLKSGRRQGVENPNCTYFDFSDVGRPAEATAHGGLAREFMSKAASLQDGAVLGGAWEAELYGMFSDGIVLPTRADEYHYRQLKLARHLAALELDMDANPKQEDISTKAAFDRTVQPALDFSPLGQPGTKKFAAGLRALAESEVMLSPSDFLAIAVPGSSSETREKAAKIIKSELLNIFGKLASDGGLSIKLNHVFSADVTAVPDSGQRALASKAASSRSYCVCQLSKRASLAILRGAAISQRQPEVRITKSASEANKEASELAEKYALYQLATLAASTKEQSPLTLRAVLVHNRS